MAIDVQSEAEKIEREVRDRLYTVTIQQWLVDRILAIVADAKREQMERDCKAVCAWCGLSIKLSLEDEEWFHCNNTTKGDDWNKCIGHDIRTAFAATEPRDIGKEIVTDLTAMCKEQARQRFDKAAVELARGKHAVAETIGYDCKKQKWPCRACIVLDAARELGLGGAA